MSELGLIPPRHDPVFGLIAAHTKVLETLDLIETETSWLLEHNLPTCDGVIDEPASVEMGLFLELLEVVPTTLAGVVALVAHLDQVNKQHPWRFEDNYATPLIGTLATAFNRMAAA